MDLQVDVLDLHFDAYVPHFVRVAVPPLRMSYPRELWEPSFAHMAPSLRCLSHSGIALGSLWITLGSRWVTLGSLGIVSVAIVVARPLEQGRAFSPDSYSAVAVTHVRPFDRKSVRFKALDLCPSNVGLSVVYVNGNMGGRGFS